jgi:hypothetical protein
LSSRRQEDRHVATSGFRALHGSPDSLKRGVNLKAQINGQFGAERREEPGQEREEGAPCAVREEEIVRAEDLLEDGGVLGEEALDRL